RMPLTHASQPPRIAQRLGPDNHPLDTPGKCFLDVRIVAHSATELNRDGYRRANSANDMPVDRTALLGPVEIHNVQPVGPEVRPATGDRNGVGVEKDFLAVIALLEAYAMAAAQVDRRVELHETSSPSTCGILGSAGSNCKCVENIK